MCRQVRCNVTCQVTNSTTSVEEQDGAHRTRRCAQNKTVRTEQGGAHRTRRCAQNKTVCTKQDGVHRKQTLCCSLTLHRITVTAVHKRTETLLISEMVSITSADVGYFVRTPQGSAVPCGHWHTYGEVRAAERKQTAFLKVGKDFFYLH